MKTRTVFEELAEDAAAGRVNTLLILGGNPAYDAPADLELAERLTRVPNTIRLGLYEDETARLCQWRLPAAHAFESWGDAETDDGDYLPVQPMIAPLYDGRSPLTVLAKLLRYETDQEYEIVQRAFAEQRVAYRTLRHSTVGCTMVLHSVHRQGFDPKLTRQVASGLQELLQTLCSRRGLLPTSWRSVFKPTRRSSTDDSRISAGSRKCPIPLRSSLGIMPR